MHQEFFGKRFSKYFKFFDGNKFFCEICVSEEENFHGKLKVTFQKKFGYQDGLARVILGIPYFKATDFSFTYNFIRQKESICFHRERFLNYSEIVRFSDRNSSFFYTFN